MRCPSTISTARARTSGPSSRCASPTRSTFTPTGTAWLSVVVVYRDENPVLDKKKFKSILNEYVR